MKLHQTKAFTLVELIIVITILAILATIGFMSYQSYTTDARDANRVTTVKQISDGLDITFVKKAAYPLPDGTLSTGSINGTPYAFRGTIGNNISGLIKMEKSVDPLSKEEYMYGVSSDRTQYQIAMVLENTVAKNNTITNTTYAAGKETAKVNGNYPGYMKFSSGSETWISNIPSLLWNNSGSVNLMNTGTYFVVDKKTNLPYKSSTTDLGTKNADTIIRELTGTSSTSLTGVNITNIKTSTDVANNFTGVLLASFGGDISKVTSNVLGGSVATSTIQNITTPFVASENFSVTTYAGNGGTQNIITGLDMTSGNNGGLVWVKSRTEAGTDISVTDSIRGNDVYLGTAGTRAEIAATDRGVYLNNSGIQVKASATHKTNELNNNYVAWSWKTTDKASGLTNHGKAYTANYNARAGFSMVGYKGSGLAEHQIAHFLGTMPELVLTKSRDQAYGWIVHSKYIGTFGADYLFLELNYQLQRAGLHIDYSANNIIQKDGSPNRNQLDKSYISYAFTSVPGFSKIGTYTGNGGTGNKITLGFEPAFLMIKGIDGVGDWILQDNKRGTGKYLWADLTNSEVSNTDFVFNTDSFTINGVSSNSLYSRNNLNGTYLYYAISK